MGIHARHVDIRTECSWNTNDDTIASTKLGGQVDLGARCALLELDGRNGISCLDHDCGIGGLCCVVGVDDEGVDDEGERMREEGRREVEREMYKRRKRKRGSEFKYTLWYDLNLSQMCSPSGSRYPFILSS